MNTTPLVTAFKSVFFEVLDQGVGETQLRLLGRLPQERVGDWLVFMHHICTKMQSHKWKVDISKSYFLRDGKIVFAWRVIFQAPDIEAELQNIINVVSTSPKSSRTAETTSIRLGNASANRNAYRNGKGAALLGKARVGPRATTEES